MIVHRQLCDGILKGWNQDPAYRLYIWERSRNQRSRPLFINRGDQEYGR